MKKYIKIEVGSYRGQDMSGRVFPIIKDYQRFSGGKAGGFVTVDCSEFEGFEGPQFLGPHFVGHCKTSV